MTLLSDLMSLAFRDSGVFGTGQTAGAQDQADALLRLNVQLDQWSRRRWLSYHLVDTSVVCDGSLSYTVGAAGDFNIARPDRIEAAFMRQAVPTSNTPVDWPLMVIQSREEYSQIALKTLRAGPSVAVWYDSGFPLGSVYPWPLANDAYELHILTKEVIGRYATVGASVDNLPPEYSQLIYLTMVNQMRAAYRLPVDGYYMGMQKAALNTIRRANFQVGRLSLPATVVNANAGLLVGFGAAVVGIGLGDEDGDALGVE